MMKPFLNRAWIVVPVAVAAAVLTGCSSKSGKHGEATAKLPTVTVHVQKVEDASRTMIEEEVGTVRAKLHATLEARVSGRISALPVSLGESVHKGQVVARLDAVEIAARLTQAQASLEEANRNWKRISKLFDQQSVTRAEYDAAQARQEIAQAAVTEAKAMLSYTKITAPFAGVISKKWVDEGDLAAPGKPLLNIEDPSTLQLWADVPDNLIGNVKVGDQLPVRIGAGTNVLQGTVAEIAPAADPSSRTSLVKLNLPKAPGVRSGRFGRVAVPVGKVMAIHAPISAVVQRGQMQLVFVVQDNRANLRLVKTGHHIGNEVEVVSGLNSGEEVVTQGALHLTDGQPVSIEK